MADAGNIINKIYLGYDVSPIGLVYDGKNDLVYVANRNKKEVAIVNMKDYEVIERVATKGLPNTIVLNEKDGSVYVTNKSSRKAEEGLENGDTVQKITKISKFRPRSIVLKLIVFSKLSVWMETDILAGDPSER